MKTEDIEKEADEGNFTIPKEADEYLDRIGIVNRESRYLGRRCFRAGLIQGRLDQKPDWISVENKLPNFGDWVLICELDKSVVIAEYNKNGRFYPTYDNQFSVEVTHWMSLPTLPNQ